MKKVFSFGLIVAMVLSVHALAFAECSGPECGGGCIDGYIDQILTFAPSDGILRPFSDPAVAEFVPEIAHISQRAQLLSNSLFNTSEQTDPFWAVPLGLKTSLGSTLSRHQFSMAEQVTRLLNSRWDPNWWKTVILQGDAPGQYQRRIFFDAVSLQHGLIAPIGVSLMKNGSTVLQEQFEQPVDVNRDRASTACKMGEQILQVSRPNCATVAFSVIRKQVPNPENRVVPIEEIMSRYYPLDIAWSPFNINVSVGTARFQNLIDSVIARCNALRGVEVFSYGIYDTTSYGGNEKYSYWVGISQQTKCVLDTIGDSIKFSITEFIRTNSVLESFAVYTFYFTPTLQYLGYEASQPSKVPTGRIGYQQVPVPAPICPSGILTLGFMSMSPISLKFDRDLKLRDIRTIAKFPLSPSWGPDAKTEWYASKKTPLLVYDPDHSGKITTAFQLFGNFTFGQYWRTGYDALATLDADGDGEVSGADETKDLALWFDDGDGVSEDGEVKPLKDTGVTAFYYKNIYQHRRSGFFIAERGFKLRTEAGDKILPSVDWFGNRMTTLHKKGK